MKRVFKQEEEEGKKERETVMNLSIDRRERELDFPAGYQGTKHAIEKRVVFSFSSSPVVCLRLVPSINRRSFPFIITLPYSNRFISFP